VAPNWEMAADWRVSPWTGKNGDDDGRKRAGDRDGSVAGVEEMRARLAMGGGERESLAARSKQRVTGVRGKIRPTTGAAHF
jgi:hypothetical protein